MWAELLHEPPEVLKDWFCEEVERTSGVRPDLRRWHVELLIKELKGATGLGQAQVTKQTQRVERSVAWRSLFGGKVPNHRQDVLKR